MIPRSLLRPVAGVIRLAAGVSSASTMATPLRDFTLDRNVFNTTLYAGITDFWFRDVAPNATTAPPQKMMQWFGVGSPEEKASFDADCSLLASAALKAIGPSKLELPVFKSHEDDKNQAAVLAAPLMEEVNRAESPSDVLLALTLLLDQMPRNLFREQATLPAVYNHYDRLALATVRSGMKAFDDPIKCYNGRWFAKLWFFMPLMHSEDLSAHKIWREEANEARQAAEKANDQEVIKFIDTSIEAQEKHADPLQKFGRYPHRNECLQRENTPAEAEYLKTADTFGVKQNSQGGKDEL